MNRIAIIGNAGSGKSTLAMQLKEITKLPVFHIDKILWKENWERTPEEEFRVKPRQMINETSWILDGVGYESTWEERLDASDTIIFLDLEKETCIKQALNRMEEDSIRPNPFVPEGCFYPIELKDRQIEVIERLDRELVPKLAELVNKFKDSKGISHLVDAESINDFLINLKESN